MNRSRPRRSVLSALLVVALGACNTGAGGDTTSTLPSTTATTSAPTTSVATTTPSETTAPAEPLPTNPADYATAAFEAWVAGGDAQLDRLLTPEALETLREIDADRSADWEFGRCEGAAGSSYCNWVGPDGTLTFRVANEAASTGREQAITEALVTGG